jgi:hypothetical protein
MYKRQHAHSIFAKCMLIIASVLLVGCANKGAAVIERYKAPGLAQLKRLQGVAEMMRDRPPLVADAESLPLDGASFMTDPKAPPNGAFVDAEWLTEEGLRDDHFNAPLSIEAVPFWEDCGAYLTTGMNSNGSPPKGDKDIEEKFQKFLKVKFLGVARTVDLRLPEVTGEAQFSSGRYRFDLYFFELADPPQYLGGIRVDASNDPNMNVKFREDMREEAMNRRLLQNLSYRTHEELNKMMFERAKIASMNSPLRYGD